MKKFILVKMFVISINNVFEGIPFENVLGNVTIILWQSLSPVSMVQFYRKI